MPIRRSDTYKSSLTRVSLSALIELGLTLKSYLEAIVLVGGWVPYFLVEEFGRNEFTHIGSIDIDLAINSEKIDTDTYASIVEMIERRGYRNRNARDGKTIQFSFVKTIQSPSNGSEYDIQVDFLTSSSINSKKHRHRKVQHDLPARITKGCELAFSHNMNKKLKGYFQIMVSQKSRLKCWISRGVLV